MSMACIVKSCPNSTGCRALGGCGADYVLKRARREDGYEVSAIDNYVVGALLSKGLIRSEPAGKRTVRLFAVEVAPAGRA